MHIISMTKRGNDYFSPRKNIKKCTLKILFFIITNNGINMGDFMKFTIGFENEDIKILHKYWDEIFLSKKWSEGKFVQTFEEKWALLNELPPIAFSSWGGAALAALEYFKLKGKTVLCPSNTFMATPLSVLKAGGNVEFVDCNKNDLCLSYDDLLLKVEKFKPAAIWVVHIGGHIAFQIEKISEFCKEKGNISHALEKMIEMHNVLNEEIKYINSERYLEKIYPNLSNFVLEHIELILESEGCILSLLEKGFLQGDLSDAFIFSRSKQGVIYEKYEAILPHLSQQEDAVIVFFFNMFSKMSWITNQMCLQLHQTSTIQPPFKLDEG